MNRMPIGEWLAIMAALSAEWGCTWEEAGEAMLTFFEGGR
jgi:hypothetical protein